jgi:hypothetical protein
MTWPEMVKTEPRLEALSCDIPAACREGNTPEEVWCRCLYRRLWRLAGFYAEREELRTREAYVLACSVILHRLVTAWSEDPMKESSLKRAVIDYLRERGFCVRKRHGSPYALTGDPDIYALRNGTHYEIELKVLGETPTPLQRLRLEEWAKAGANVMVIHSMDELRASLSELQTAERGGHGRLQAGR